MGTGLNSTKTKLHECTKPNLHNDTKLHEETKMHKNGFAPRVNFARVTFLHESKKYRNE